MNELFSKSIFSFCLYKSEEVSEKVSSDFEVKQCIGDCVLHADDRTPLDYCKSDGRELIIFGYAVDVYSGQSEKLAETILRSAKSIDAVIDAEKKLGGKYIIFYAENGKCFCLGDATCSVPIFYTVGLSEKVCCSNPQMIVNEFKLKKDSYLQSIRDSGKPNQAMPFDVTPYKEIKRLIPNHCLDFSGGQAKRFVNEKYVQKIISPEKAAEITAPMIENITKMYLAVFKIYCPLTSGRDSRVVYAFLNDLGSQPINSYTIWHNRFKNDDQDWVVPLSLSKLCNGQHQRLYQETVTDEIKTAMDEVLGKGGYPQDAFTLSVTVNNHFLQNATIEGDIIGQVGKCSLHRNIPLCLATPRYFRCKVHNYSDGARKFLKMWINEIKESKEKVNPFDLFSVENRLGVWASHTHLLRNIMGMPYVNIFNSRNIIYTWTAVDRSKRMKSLIHVALIKIKAPQLLSVPFETEKSSVKSVARSNAAVFYLASFAKYYIEKRKFYNEKHADKG